MWCKQCVSTRLVCHLLLFICCTLHLQKAVESKPDCNFERSRVARQVIKQFVLPAVQALDYQLPQACPLRPEAERFWPWERTKQRQRHGRWRCGECGKVFHAEHFLDHHAERSHLVDIVPPGSAGVCLADACEALHCDALAALAPGWAHSPADPYSRHAPCRASAAAAHRRECEDIMEKCFPPVHGGSARLLNRQFKSRLCAAHTCDASEKSRLLKLVAKGRGRGRLGYVLLAALGAVLLAPFYGGMWLYYTHAKGSRRPGDLRRVQRKKPLKDALWQRLFGKAKAF